MNSQRRMLLSALTAIAAMALVIHAPSHAADQKPVRVVATFSILGDMVKRVGGKHVSVTTLVGPDSDNPRLSADPGRRACGEQGQDSHRQWVAV